MNSTEQELPANKEKEESPLATTDTTDVFKPPDENKESGDTETKINDDDLKTNYVDSKLETDKEIPEEVALKQADLNKSSEFDDDDDFNSEEMRLRWDDDDDEINDEKSNNELNESFSKESESNTPSLVTAVKELENALEETTSEDVKNSEADHDLVDPEGSSSKDILEDIDKLIGNDDTAVKQVKSNSEKDNGDITISNENDVVVSKESDETDNLKINDNSDIKLDVSSSDGSTNIDINSKSNNLDESIESDQMINENSILSSTVNDSILEGNSKFEHGLKRPDMMLEIPTQEIIDCLDDFDSVESLNASDQIDSMEKDIDSKVESLNASDQIDSMEKDIDSKNLDDKIKLIDQDISDHVSELTEKYLKAQSSEIEMKSQQSVENIFMTEKDEVEDNVIVDSIKVDNDVEMCDVSKNGNKDAITFKTSSPVQDPVTEVEEIKASENNPICEKPATAQILENKGEEKQTSIKPLNEDLNNQTNEKLDEKAPENIDNDVTQSLEPVSTESSDKTSNKVIEGILTTSDDIPTTAVEPKADTEQPSKDLENNEPKSISKDPLLSTLSEIKDNTELASENVELKGATDSVDEEPNISSVLDQKSISKNTTDLEQKAETTPILDQSEQSDVDTNIGTTVKLDQPKEAKDTNNTKPISEQPSTSKMVLENQVDKEHKKETSAENPTDKEDQDQLPDTTDEVPEMEDTLGLLAESSRVVEDAEASSGDGDEDDDDEDFDPDDESSNQVSAYQSEESNAQPDKEDPQTGEKKEKKDFFSVTSVTCEDGAKDDDLQATAEDADKVPDVTAVPEEDTVATSDTATEVNQDDVETAVTNEQPKFLETAKLFATSDEETEKAASILKDLLLKDAMPPVEAAKTSADNGVVDLESSSEEDVQQKKEETTKKSELDAVEKEETKPTQEDTKTVTEKKGVGGNSEVFNLDSDEDDIPAIANEVVIEEKAESNKCINPSCPSGPFTPYVLADVAARAYFDANKKKKYKVCTACAEAVAERTKGLVSGIKGMTPLLELDLRKVSSDTVEISDSDSDDGESESVKPDVLGESGAKFLEENLADVINETWIKYKLDERLGDAQKELTDELAKLEEESKEIDTMLNECQVATDLLRNQLYATFEPERRELTAIFIIDTPTSKSSYCENSVHESRLKRKASTSSDQPTKKAAIPLGYTPIESDTGAEKGSKQIKEDSTADDDKDVSVVKLSAEAAPSDLPPPGEISRPQLRAGMSVFAMRNSFCTWLPGKIIDVHPKNPANPFTMCRVRFEVRNKVLTRILAARCLAYIEPADVRLTIGTRVIALSKENAKTDDPTKKKSFYSGIVAEIPNPVNNYRYLIFFDHGYAQYVQHRETRVVCESASLVWEEVHPNSREFVKQYLLAYPERPMVRLHAGQSLKTEWNGKWWVTKVLQVDASLVEVSFEDNRSEWIYRGSTRLAPLFLELQAAERQRARPLPRSNQRRMNMPYVEYTRSDEQNKPEAVAPETTRQQQQQNDELRRQRAVAKKSTSAPAPPPATHHNLDSVTSRVVYYTPKNAVKPHKLSPHACSPKCRRGDTLALKDLRTYNPLAKPLLSGWERQIVRFKGHKEVMYRAPCGRRLRSMRELHRYLRLVQSDMGVDLFDFGANTHCLAEFVLNKCLVGKKDLSHGKENVPVPCVNYYDESLPEFCSYNTERTPTAGVPLNLDPDFLCGCDCTDDCEDKSKCACWKMTLEGARTIGLQGPSVGYEYKRLQEPLPSGIYECNSRCKCKHTCLNRVAQHPLQLKLQVFKTMNRGWGIRALNDVPKGSFLCVYAGNLLTDATANLDGLNEGDEYLAELDYIEVVEQMKEGYEEDIPEADKKLDRKSSKSSSQEEESSSEEESANKNDKMDDDFQPGSIGLGLTEFNKRLRKRDRTRKGARDRQSEKGKEIDKGMEDDGCITISDDEEAKEPTRFMVQAGIGGNEFVSKYRSVRSLFGKDEACYIMDAKVQGNIGRYLNHSCTPNVFVQNVFVDTHDPRFPWVAFFALSHIRAGTELTWNYNYDVGSVPGKVLYCYCGAPNCRGRLL